MDIVQLVSVFLEIMVTVVALMIAVGKNKVYGWCFTLTFMIYVFYDVSRFAFLNVPADIMSIMFFIASFSALWGIWSIYKEA
ncbi:MAG TPA: hypothetical protein VMD02_03480 [Candidatus Omnitrophota bacterium]|nr:hypothetical protein [Candidatus Omnitrophota bacterium]